MSEERRRRVLEAIRRLGYRPNRVARALRGERTGLFGLVLPDATLPFFGSLARALEREVFAAGGLMFIGNTGFSEVAELSITRAFLDMNVDGVFVAAEEEALELDDTLAAGDARYVRIHCRPPASGAPVVASDHRRAGQLAGEHLAFHGRREVVFVGAEGPQGVVGLREAGWRQASTGGTTVARTDLTPADAYEKVGRALRDTPHVDGMVVGTYGLAKAVVGAVLDHGARVPDDIAVITFDGDDRSAFERPRLATVQQDIDELARRAVRIVLGERRAGPESEPDLLPVHFVGASSCGCPDPDAGVAVHEDPSDVQLHLR